MNRKSFQFELKDVSEGGAFVGLASVYGNLDLGGDIVDKGAFAKTLAESGAEVPILWQHDTTIPIGLGTLEDTPAGLVINGQLDLDVEEGARAYSGMKKGYLKGLSIGYTVVRQVYANGARHLKELKLYEVSTVTFPMNELAEVTRVKAGRVLSQETCDTMSEALDHLAAGRAQIKAAHREMAAGQKRAQLGHDLLRDLLSSNDSTTLMRATDRIADDDTEKSLDEIESQMHANMRELTAWVSGSAGR